MTDAVALLAISQIVCLGGLAYLYAQVQKLRHGGRQPRPRASVPPQDRVSRNSAPGATRAAREAYSRATPTEPPPAAQAPRSAAELAAHLTSLGVDVPALARRMNRSEEEIRLLLRRRGMAR
ncbi:MAG: hypothetical protein ACKVT1_09820 [Dehalococcoidia bacterium]